jgi:adenosylmethionine-8-amino-7-oxononanoate aminotransferase
VPLQGLTGGYLPLSVVLTREPVYAAFYDEYAQLRAFLHSHSYTGNALACTAAVATLDIFADDDVIERNRALAAHLGARAQEMLGGLEHVAEVRQCGMIVAAEMARRRQALGSVRVAGATRPARLPARARARGAAAPHRQRRVFHAAVRDHAG